MTLVIGLAINKRDFLLPLDFETPAWKTVVVLATVLDLDNSPNRTPRDSCGSFETKNICIDRKAGSFNPK
jgi:hypothetical protein